jgi:hypothetical protein
MNPQRLREILGLNKQFAFYLNSQKIYRHNLIDGSVVYKDKNDTEILFFDQHEIVGDNEWLDQQAAYWVGGWRKK